MKAVTRLERAYMAGLVSLGAPVGSNCSTCGGRLSWFPVGFLDRTEGPAVAAEVWCDVVQHGGDETSPVTVCLDCGITGAWLVVHGDNKGCPHVSLDGLV